MDRYFTSVFGPRFRCHGLEVLRLRRAEFTVDFGEGEAHADASELARSRRDRQSGLFGGAIVIAEHLLIDVTLTVERMNGNIGSLESAVQRGSVVFASPTAPMIY